MTLKHFKTDLKAVQYMITQSGESSWSLEKSTGISRQTIDRWMKADHLKIRRATLSDFASKLNYQVQYNKDGIAVSPHIKKQNTGDLPMEQQQMLIKYQQQEIEKLKKQINQHEDVYDGIDSDIVFKFEIKFNWSLKNPAIKVRYLSQESTYIPIMAKKLGYTESEIAYFLQIDEMVDYKIHNIHKLRTEKQKQEMISIMKQFLTAYRNIKVNTTLLVAEIPVAYTHQNGTIFMANVEYRVNWIKGTGTAHIRWLKD